MKKILLFLVILLVLSSCTIMKTISVYQNYYPQEKEQQSVTDLYSVIKEHSVDSIALDKWLTLQAQNDNGYILQRTISSVQDEKTSWKFIYTQHVVIDSTFFSVKALISTKDKKLQKFYGK